MRTITLTTANGRRVGEVRIADSFIARRLGLARNRIIGDDRGLLLIPCGSVHTIGMRFAIDVVFLDRRMRVLALVSRAPPYRFCLAPHGTRQVLELAAGRIAEVDLRVGMYLLVADARDLGAAPTRSLGPHTRSSAPCTVPPIQFSLRLPPQQCSSVQSNLGCARAPSRALPPVPAD